MSHTGGFQPVPNTARLVARYVRGTNPATADWISVNIHHWRRVLGWTSIALGQLVSEYVVWWRDNVRTRTPSNMRLYDVVATDIGAEFGLESVDVPDEAGTNASTSPLPILSAVVQWRGDPGAPPRTGRTFWGGIKEEDIAGDAISAGEVTALQAAFDNLRDVTVSASAALVLVSRFSGTHFHDLANGETRKFPTRRAQGLTNTIASVAVRDVVGSQERRRRGG